MFIDFGAAYYDKDTYNNDIAAKIPNQSKTLTYAYCPPEYEDRMINFFAFDIWSLGVVLLECLFACYFAENFELDKIKQDKLNFDRLKAFAHREMS